MSKESSISKSLGLSLGANTLHAYLKDPTFVEYFNSFLLLPAFSNRVYYNQDTGYFELVQHDSIFGCMEGEPTPSSSLSTLYLLSDSLGPALDMKQSWDWLIQYRLPLFLRSDIYSEYKICKLLTTQSSTSNISTSNSTLKIIPSSQGRSCLSPILIQELEGPTEKLNQQQQQRDEFNLPEINFVTSYHQSSAMDLTSDQEPFSKHPHILTYSKSDAQLDPHLCGRNRRRVQWCRRLSVDPATLNCGSPQRQGQPDVSRSSASVRCESVMGDSTGSVSTGMSIEDARFLCTKSGMSALWKFLRGKAGEKNWLFWLDAERVKYYKGIDQQRMIKDFRECYFLDSGSPLELPAEIRQKVNRAAHFTPELLQELQETMVTGLIEYWCPRFLLHHHLEQDASLSASTPQLPAVFHSNLPALQAAGHLRHCSYPPSLTTTQSPSRTPTFKRVHLKSLSLPKSLLPIDRKTSESPMAAISPGHHCMISSETQNDETLGREGDDFQGCSGIRKIVSGGWQSHQDMHLIPNTEDVSLVKRTAPSTSSSLARYSRLAKYSARHLPDPSSRCASRMEGSEGGSICKSRCTILSISGTPADTPDHHYSRACAYYEPLLKCLAVENRKAGGYFMHFLEKLESKVYFNSLLFWRDVQDYKALFVGKVFRPCAVEMKSKIIFGRYISEGCTNSIECSDDIVNIISFNLWPAYEDLLDLAEEHAVGLLFLQWNVLCTLENDAFEQLDAAVLSSSVSNPWKSTHTTSDMSGLESFLEEKESLYEDQSLRASTCGSPHRPLSRSTPASLGTDRQAHVISLNDVINDAAELEFFKVFLNDKLAAQDLMCWIDIENFRGIPVSDKAIRHTKAKRIRKNHLNRKYFFGLNSPASKEAQRQIVQAGEGRYGSMPARPSTPVLREVQKHVRARLVKVWLAEFMLSLEFMERHQSSTSSSSWDKSSTNFKQATYKHSFIHSHEAILFRKFLTKSKCINFQNYLKIKALSGRSTLLVLHPKENIEFWREVQKYKGMCHAHTRESTLSSKARAIKDCFLFSPSPPELQIDIPMHIVEQVSRKSHGPYLFREAQAVVFSNLYNAWKEYKRFVTGLNNRDFKRALEKLKIGIQKQMRDQENYNREEEERRKMWIPKFETAEEKEQRIKNEREMAKFGPIAVEFRLSTPDPRNYTYFTDLPIKYYITEDVEEANDKSSRRSTENIAAPSGRIPLVVMKMRGSNQISHHIKQRIKATRELSQINESHCHTPCPSEEPVSVHKGESTNQLCDMVSGSITGSDDRCPRKSNPKGARKNKSSHTSSLPNPALNTISIQMSLKDNGKAVYAYGRGLPEEEASYLEITSNCEHQQ